MGKAVVLFVSTSHALRAQRICQGFSINGKLVPVPRHLSSDCGLALEVSSTELESVMKLLVDNNVVIQGGHQLEDR